MKKIDYSMLDVALSMVKASKDTRPLQVSPDSLREKVKIKLKEGVKVEATNFDDIETIGGMFSHEGEHAFLYIDEPRESKETLREEPAINAQRFHLVKRCTTLITMHNKGRSERYVLIQNSDGTFPSKPFDFQMNRWITNEKIDAKLLPCKNCLEELSYQGYVPHRRLIRARSLIKEKNMNIFLNFDVKKFFAHYEPFFFDANYYRKFADDGKANYAREEHVLLRDKLLHEDNFTCSEVKCRAELSDRPDLLHLHHMNGRRGDNKRQNAKILCILCHSLQPNHSHMKNQIRTSDLFLIERRRAAARQNK